MIVFSFVISYELRNDPEEWVREAANNAEYHRSPSARLRAGTFTHVEATAMIDPEAPHQHIINYPL